MRPWILLSIIAGSLLVGRSASAGGKAQNNVLTQENIARTACLAGDYQKGIAILAELYVANNQPNYLFNQGRCYEQNVKYLEAAERFREFVRKAGKTQVHEKEEAEKHIAECEAAYAKLQVKETPPPPPPPPPVLVKKEEPDPPPPPPPPPMVLVHPWQHTAKWVAASAALAFLGLGVVEHLNYYSKNNDYNKGNCSGSGCKDLANSADTAHTLAIVGYSAAGVAAGLAVVFFLTDKPRLEPAKTSALDITCAPTPTGVGCRGRF